MPKGKNEHNQNKEQNQVCYSIKNETFDKLSKSLEANMSIVGKAAITIQNVLKLLQMSTGSVNSDVSRDDVPPSGIVPNETAKGQRWVNAREGKVVIELKVTFLKIMEINTFEEHYKAEVFIQAKWEEPKLDNLTEKDTNNFNPKEYWNPSLRILNLEEKLSKSEKTYSVKLQEPGYDHPLVLLSWRLKAVFKEAMELQHFPFDVQEITLNITSDRSETEVALIPDRRTLSAVNVHTFHEGGEWGIYEHVECDLGITSVEYGSVDTHPILYVTCHVRRRMGYFLWNIVLILLLIMLMSFALAVIDASATDRMTLTLTLFLTAVAFKLATVGRIPTISYLTYLDIYILVTLFFLGLMIGQNALLFAFSTMFKDKYQFWDMVTMILLGVFNILFHVGFCLYIWKTAFARRRLMRKNDQVYRKKKEHLSKYGLVIPGKELLIKDAAKKEMGIQ